MILLRNYLLTSICFSAAFDPAAFMTQTIDQPLEDEFKLCPEGEYLNTFIDDFDQSVLEVIPFKYKQGQRQGQDGEMTKFTCPFVINSEEAKKALNRDKVIVTAQLILDIAENGGLDFGINKNVRLGQIRTAVGQKEVVPWSIGNLRGAGPCLAQVKHIAYKRPDGSDGKRAEVVRVARQA